MSGRRHGPLGAFGVALALTLGGPGLAAEPAGPLPSRALQVEDAPYGHFGRTITARFHVRATPAQAYGILTDHARLREFMPMVEDSTLVRAAPGRAVVRFRLRYFGWFDIVEVDERALEPPRRIRWHAVEGPLRVSDGAWTFEPAPAGATVTYQTDVDPGVPLPSPLTGMLLRRGLPDFLEAVRQRIESGGRWRKPAA